MDNKKFGMRLKTLRQEQGFNQENVANYLKTRPSTSTPKADKSLISKYETGKTGPQKWDTMTALATMFGVNPNYLSGTSDNRYSEDKFLCKHIPIVNNSASGNGEELHSAGVECVPAHQDIDFCIIAPDDSLLHAGIKKDCSVFARKDFVIENSDIIVARIDEQPPILRRYYNHKTMVILRPDNQSSEDIIIDAGETDRLNVIGKVIYFKCEVK